MAKYEPNEDQPVRKVQVWRATWPDATQWWVWFCPCTVQGYQPTHAQAIKCAVAHTSQHTPIEGWVNHPLDCPRD